MAFLKFLLMAILKILCKFWLHRNVPMTVTTFLGQNQMTVICDCYSLRHCKYSLQISAQLARMSGWDSCSISFFKILDSCWFHLEWHLNFGRNGLTMVVSKFRSECWLHSNFPLQAALKYLIFSGRMRLAELEFWPQVPQH